MSGPSPIKSTASVPPAPSGDSSSISFNPFRLIKKAVASIQGLFANEDLLSKLPEEKILEIYNKLENEDKRTLARVSRLFSRIAIIPHCPACVAYSELGDMLEDLITKIDHLGQIDIHGIHQVFKAEMARLKIKGYQEEYLHYAQSVEERISHHFPKETHEHLRIYIINDMNEAYAAQSFEKITIDSFKKHLALIQLVSSIGSATYHERKLREEIRDKHHLLFARPPNGEAHLSKIAEKKSQILKANPDLDPNLAEMIAKAREVRDFAFYYQICFTSGDNSDLLSQALHNIIDNDETRYIPREELRELSSSDQQRLHDIIKMG